MTGSPYCAAEIDRTWYINYTLIKSKKGLPPHSPGWAAPGWTLEVWSTSALSWVWTPPPALPPPPPPPPSPPPPPPPLFRPPPPPRPAPPPLHLLSPHPRPLPVSGPASSPCVSHTSPGRTLQSHLSIVVQDQAVLSLWCPPHPPPH